MSETARRRSCATQLKQHGLLAGVHRAQQRPINAILFDREHGTMWGGSSHNGEDYGIAW